MPETQRFNGQVVVITGGAAGIGLATARRIGAEGGRIALLDRSAGSLEAAITSLTNQGIDCLGVRGDAGTADDCEAVVGMALQEWDRLDVLVANAAERHQGLLLDVQDADWERVLAVNLRGAAHACTAAVHAMRECGIRGALVLVSSVNAYVGRSGHPLYDASKAALCSLARSLAVELASDGIRVNSVCPGPTQPDDLGEMPSEREPRTQPGLFGRAARPEEIAAAIAFLASADASYVTATNLMVDAGLHAI